MGISLYKVVEIFSQKIQKKFEFLFLLNALYMLNQQLFVLLQRSESLNAY